MRVCLLFVTACWSAAETAPVAPVIEAPIYSGPIARSRPAFPLHSVWEGTYVCAQGLSYVKLTFDARRDGTTIARYDFGATPSNPSVPTGAYLLKGTYQVTTHGFTTELEADEWIDQPQGYFMVGLSLQADGRELTGTIQHPTCSGFQAHRID